MNTTKYEEVWHDCQNTLSIISQRHRWDRYTHAHLKQAEAQQNLKRKHRLAHLPRLLPSVAIIKVKIDMMKSHMQEIIRVIWRKCGGQQRESQWIGEEEKVEEIRGEGKQVGKIHWGQAVGQWGPRKGRNNRWQTEEISASRWGKGISSRNS